MLTLVALALFSLPQALNTPAAVLAEARRLIGQPETEAGMRRIEALLSLIPPYDASGPDYRVLGERVSLHAEMLNRYRTAKAADGIRTHATLLTHLEHRLHPATSVAPASNPRARASRDEDLKRQIRSAHSAVFLPAFLDVARDLAAAGDRDQAIRSLTRAERCLADIRGAVAALRAERDRIRR